MNKLLKYFKPLPFIETPRLILRRAYLTDTEDLFLCMKNKNVCRYEVWQPHNNVIETLGFINSLITKYDDNTCTDWVIERKRDNKAIGVINLHDIIEQNLYAETGFWLGEEYWNNGYAAESALAVLNFAFNVMGLNRVCGMCDTENTHSEKLLKNLNMTYEGTLRQHIKIGSEFRNIKVFSILKHEFQHS
ncbi:MAG: hypothetical protein DBX47_02815 [Clostridiales bacterium]|nr:MAG: hypothetical protein DBX47_02815 [Clostridiales bacterium]